MLMLESDEETSLLFLAVRVPIVDAFLTSSRSPAPTQQEVKQSRLVSSTRGTHEVRRKSGRRSLVVTARTHAARQDSHVPLNKQAAVG
jgi:hypothetical protein